MKKVLWLMSAIGLTVTSANAQSGTITIISSSKTVNVVAPSTPTQTMSDEELNQTNRAIDGLLVNSYAPTQNSSYGYATMSDRELDSAIDELLATSASTSQFSQSFATGDNSYLHTTPQSFSTQTPQYNSVVSSLSRDAAPAVAARAAARAAHGRSIGRCALYVRKALQAAGYKFTPNPSAYQYAHGTLSGAGFTKISTNNYTPQVGDVAVFNRSSKHPHGHIQIYDGKQWVSDFRQPNFSPYRQHNGYSVWRDTRYLDASANTGTYLAMNEQ